MRQIIALALKDLRLMPRNRGGMFFTFVWPVLVTVLFGIMFGGQDDGTQGKVRIAIVDNDNTDGSRAFLKKLEESFELIGHLYRIPRADRAARLRRLEEVLALGPLLGVPVRSLSLGQRMRAELAAAVLPAPEVLFLDEPTIGLDVEAKAAVRDFLRELNRSEGTTVILTTHDLDDITRLCSRLMIIDHGRRIYDGTVEALRTAYGTTRVLVVDLADDEPAEVAGAVLTRAEGRRRWFQFARDEVSAAELIARLLAGHEVADLTLEEPDIEDIVRRIYRGETPP